MCSILTLQVRFSKLRFTSRFSSKNILNKNICLMYLSSATVCIFLKNLLLLEMKLYTKVFCNLLSNYISLDLWKKSGFVFGCCLSRCLLSERTIQCRRNHNWKREGFLRSATSCLIVSVGNGTYRCSRGSWEGLSKEF